MYFKACLKVSTSLLDIMGNLKEISQNLWKEIVDTTLVYPLGTISKRLKVHCSAVQTVLSENKNSQIIQYRRQK